MGKIARAYRDQQRVNWSEIDFRLVKSFPSHRWIWNIEYRSGDLWLRLLDAIGGVNGTHYFEYEAWSEEDALKRIENLRLSCLPSSIIPVKR